MVIGKRSQAQELREFESPPEGSCCALRNQSIRGENEFELSESDRSTHVSWQIDFSELLRELKVGEEALSSKEQDGT
jgi:hypothetical protein